MRLHLVDYNGLLVNAWTEAFRQFPEVTIQTDDLLAVAEHCVVSPANSYGFMDGGIDAAYRAFFGAQIELTVQDAENAAESMAEAYGDWKRSASVLIAH